MLDFLIAEEIILKAEKIKMRKAAKNKQQSTKQVTLTLSDAIEGYKKVMKQYGIDTVNETHYYAMIVKLSLNKQGKTWRESLNFEK